jgi:hypothetical protein
MKIIQSFAQFDEGSFYLKNSNDGANKAYLNFYSMLLSVLTLQKYYGEVTMYCNQKAYDSFIKYIPYNEIKIVENKNSFNFWNYYKVDAIRKQTTKFIHVDPDVFIFDDLFSEFFDTRKYDIIVQDVIPDYLNPISGDMLVIREYLKKHGIMNHKLCDGKAFSNGVVGMNIKVKKEFVKFADTIKKAYEDKELKVGEMMISMISEELALYLVARKNNYSYHEILPYNHVLKDGSRDKTNEKKFTHMWGHSKFNLKYVELMKRKIRKEFPEYSALLDEYDSRVAELL